MTRSFIFSDGKAVGQDLELEALRLVRADKGLLLWVDMDNPTPEEIKTFEGLLPKAAPRMTADQRASIAGYLTKHAPKTN